MNRVNLYKGQPAIAILCFLILCGCSAFEAKEPPRKPNILLIVADDLGYSDLGCYGGEIETPHIDRLAESGILFTNFHTSPFCAPTRAMLLSGNDNHIAGVGRQSVTSTEFGYEGRLTTRIKTVPEILRSAGYNTYIAGKWHLGYDSIADPFSKDFTRSFVNLGSSGNHYNDQGLFESMPRSRYTENGIPTQWPEGKYSTDVFTDKLIGFIELDRSSGQPFFAVAAYTAPHWPLQVDESYRKKYEGKYDGGYEWLRKERLKGLKRNGIISDSARLPKVHPRVTPWDSLDAFQKKVEARKMELYAGMVDNLDVNIGRLLEYLEQIGVLDNTLIVFMSDNGAAAEDFYYHDRYGPFIREHFTDSYEAMGKPHSFISYGPQWAEAGATPFRYFKGQVTEGGIVAPLIVCGTGVETKGTCKAFLTVQDLAPTFYEYAGTAYPANGFHPLKGKSMAPLLSDECSAVHDSSYVFALEHGGRAFVRKGDWKLVHNNPVFHPDSFTLYNLRQDLLEEIDISQDYPFEYEAMLAEWKKFSQEIRPQFPTPSSNSK